MGPAGRLALLAGLALGCGTTPAVRPRGAARPSEVSSNIRRSDYAGSRACERCHADLYQSWLASPMHRMTRVADAAEVHAPFDGSVFRFKDDRVQLERRGGELWMRIISRAGSEQLFRVTRVIGGHHREDFAGVELGNGSSERVLPVSFMLSSRTLRYKGYSVMVRERPGLRPGAVWNRTCIFCHNTVPYLSTVLGALAPPGTPPYQGEVVDALLPSERRRPIEVTDAAGLARALVEEMEHLGVRAPASGQPLADTVRAAVAATRSRFEGSHLLEVGIGCESCHGGSREHVQDFHVRPSFEVKSPLVRVRAPSEPAAAARAQHINRTCARCHQVLFSRYPWTWEGGERRAHPGGSHINSGEARDFLLGACASRLACTGCHDPHAADTGERMRERDDAQSNRVCIGCHPALGGSTALAAHSHHAPDGAAGSCVSCHMARKNMSLETRLTRYHRIGSPNDPTRVERDRPLECALCHPRASVSALVAAMERWWGRSYDRAALLALYGDLERGAMMATLERGRPHEQVVAVSVLGEARAKEAIPQLARELVASYPLVRYYAEKALESVLERRSPLDLSRRVEQIEADAERWLKASGVTVSRAQLAWPMAPAITDDNSPDED